MKVGGTLGPMEQLIEEYLRCLSRGIQISLVMGIENSLPSPCVVRYAMASAPFRRPALIFSLSR
jgi:hypothetical protein